MSDLWFGRDRRDAARPKPEAGGFDMAPGYGGALPTVQQTLDQLLSSMALILGSESAVLIEAGAVGAPDSIQACYGRIHDLPHGEVLANCRAMQLSRQHERVMAIKGIDLLRINIHERLPVECRPLPDLRSAMVLAITPRPHTIWHFVLFRSERQPAYGPHEERTALALFPLVQQHASQLMALTDLQQQNGWLREAWDVTDVGMMVVRDDGHIVTTNAAAGKVLASGRGLLRTHGRFAARSPVDAAALQAGLMRVASGRAHHYCQLVASEADEQPLSVLIRPLSETRQPAWLMVFLIDPSADRTDLIPLICDGLHLTPVETRLVCHLVQGLAVKEAASAMNISAHTARTYLKNIFSKTGLSRQADLVRMLLVSGVGISLRPRER